MSDEPRNSAGSATVPHVASVRADAAPMGATSPVLFVHRPSRPAYAALDLGTNNCRLLVAKPEGASFRVIDAFSRIVRLGEGLGTSNRLTDAAMERSIEALKVCAAKMEHRHVTRARLIATEACRTAENGAEFIAAVKAETGLALDVIDRRTEARLAAQGCSPLADPHAAGVALFDIGGGSTELVWLVPRASSRAIGPPQCDIRAWTSLPVGVVTVSERHGGRDVTPGQFERMVSEVADHVSGFRELKAMQAQLGGMHLLGTSGTVTTLAGLHLGLLRYERRRVDGAWLTRSEVDTVMGQLLATTYEDRVANACIGAERADLVLAGCAIFEGIRRHLPCERLRVADRGLREGILVELMRADDVWRRRYSPYGRRWS